MSITTHRCSAIRFELGADITCRDYQHWGKIKSPILLGMTSVMRREAGRALLPQRFATERPDAADMVVPGLERLVGTSPAGLCSPSHVGRPRP